MEIWPRAAKGPALGRVVIFQTNSRHLAEPAAKITRPMMNSGKNFPMIKEESEMEKKAKGSFLKGKSLRLLGFSVPIMGFLAAAIVLVILAAGVLHTAMNRGTKREVITVSTLEKIVHVSELSTFTAVYNGIAEVADEEKSDKIEYYVSYDAKVNAGIDFEKIAFEIDSEAKIIHVNLPKVHISKVNVDITSLDYIFINDKKNGSSISQEAYKACEKDAQSESEKEEAIFELAKQNAENIVRALIEPFMEQLDSAYTLDIDWEG